jgi:signal transduction histidine kinase
VRASGRGLRSELHVLPPVALLVLLVLTAFTLVSYRSAIALLIQERQGEAADLARFVVAALPSGAVDSPRLQQLRTRLVPQTAGLAVLDAARRPLAETGSLADLSTPLPAVERPIGIGPAQADTVVGLAPYVGAGGRRHYLRVDVAAPTLGRHARALPILTWVVAGVSVALFVTVLLYLRQLMEPYRLLLDRARMVAGAGGSSETAPAGAGDEVEFLLQTFDRAIDALSAGPAAGEPGRDEDFAALERTLAPSLESGLLLLDAEGVVLTLNAIGTELLGIDSPVAGLDHSRALAGHRELGELLSQAMSSDRGTRRRQCMVRSGERTLTLGLSVHPLRRDDGSKRGWLVLFADLTRAERRAEEQRLAKSLAQIGEITAGVAHEMRNSLASLRGHLSLLERRAAGGGDLDDGLTEIRHEADHLKRVLDDFLSFARPGSARLERIDLLRLACRAVADPALGGSEVRVHPSDVRLPPILGDPQLLERAVRNVVHNAVEAQRAASPEAPVEIRFRRTGDEVELLVEDRGCGIPDELRDRLFAPFVSGRSDGVGLGLALTHRILDLHRGRIHLEDREGGGVRAILSFPVDSFATDGNNETAAAVESASS